MSTVYCFDCERTVEESEYMRSHAVVGHHVNNTKMKTITKNQHLQLVGLLTLAGRHMKMLESISEAALSITGEREDDGREGR